MERRQPVSGEFYRHFKGNLYQVKMLARDERTQEQVVVYQALYPPFGCWVRGLEDFMAPVDREKYPECSRQFRFERVEGEDLLQAGVAAGQGDGAGSTAAAGESKGGSAAGSSEESSAKDGQISSEFFRKAITSGQPERYLRDRMKSDEIAERGFLELLDAETFREKRQIFIGMREYLTPLLLNNIAAALDIVLEDGDVQEQYDSVLRCLDAFEHYEGGRLR